MRHPLMPMFRCFGLVIGLLAAAQGGLAAASTFSTELQTQLMVADSGLQVDPATQRVGALRSFYAARNREPLFTGQDGLSTSGAAVVRAIENAAKQGLVRNDYPLTTDFVATDQAARVVAEISIGAAYLRYAGDLTEGRVTPGSVDPELFVHRRVIDRTALLNAIATAPDPAQFLTALVPSNPNYRRLQRALSEHRKISAAGGWPVLPDGPTLRLGDSGDRVGLLRQRLVASGDLSATQQAATVFDAALELAIKRFQTRHGLDSDGAVGRQTTTALNVSVDQRINQIIANMERWRWMPDDLGDRYVLVNIAAFEMEVVEDGRQVMQMPVVVGRRYRRTPVFSDEIEFLELNPFWNVPPRIAGQDIVPKVVENANYLAEQGFRVFSDWSAQALELPASSVDWPALVGRRFPHKLRQDPSDKNALGRVKFMFPNEHNVYLHDTPARELFDNNVRAFSSGCIRLARPLELAEYLLSAQGWDRARIDAAVASGETKAVVLQTKVAVHLTYSTAWVGEGGTVHFRDDIYDRDQPLIAALFGNST